jgi:hypothetical protein
MWNTIAETTDEKGAKRSESNKQNGSNKIPQRQDGDCQKVK